MASPNFDDRPKNTIVDTIVIHAISLPPDQFGGAHVEQFFTNCLDPDAHPYFREICELRVSSHFLITRVGEIIGFVPLEKRAWHAGMSNFNGRDQVNDFSIGIELEGCDRLPFEDAQYQQLAALVGSIQTHYPDISLDRIVGHSDIAPGRKTDPGPCFDWVRFRELLVLKNGEGV